MAAPNSAIRSSVMPTSTGAAAASSRRIAVIGGGITGVAAAQRMASLVEVAGSDCEVVLYERDDAIGGRIAGSTFAGLDAVDCGADAFLARVPDARNLAAEVGLAGELVHPEPVGAAIWYDGLHDIPAGLVLGVPGNPIALARSGLLSVRGIARAALEPFLPRTPTESDSIGEYVRARFGDEVHERLVDALVGSIYATDTDRFSLEDIPQLAALTGNRSLLLAARRVARQSAGTATSAAAPIFATPRGGMHQLVTSTAVDFVSRGGTLRVGHSPHVERASSDGWIVDGDAVDAVILATPAAVASTILRTAGVTNAAAQLATAETADVAMITAHVDAAEFPDRLAGRSGYLVPKPVQRDVTAVSFASQKWAHWRPPVGGEILRVSIGRDGAPALHLSDDELVERALADLELHVGTRFSPREVRVTRWPGAFAQYRPHHQRWVEQVRRSLPEGTYVAGSSYDGIGIPACVRSGRTMAERAVHDLGIVAS
jgi:protoporphyrinogen/coproporphyrinogen III oxidase